MTRLLLLALTVFCALFLPACGRSDGPDEPLYSLDQTTPANPADPMLAGRWETVLATSVDPRPLVLTIDLGGPEPDVRMTSPSQGGAVIAFDQVRLDGRGVAFATTLGAFRFEGALQGEDRIAGEVFQGGLKSDLAFDRARDSGQDVQGGPP